MKIEKFTVQKLVGTPSGNYAQYISGSGTTTLTKNFGYQIGDVVEVWDYDGYAPMRIDVNGKTIWTEENRIQYWKNYDPKSRYLTNPYRIKQ